MKVTLKDLRKAGACFSGYNRLVRSLQGREFTNDDEVRESYISYLHDDPVSIAHIVKSNGLNDALWSLRCVKGHDRDLRLFAVWCARQVEQNEVCAEALNVAERYANGQATEDDLVAVARSAERSAERSAAWSAARSAAWSAAWSAAEEAWSAAAWSAAAWSAAARSAAWSGAAWSAEAAEEAWSKQADMLVKICNGEAPWSI